MSDYDHYHGYHQGYPDPRYGQQPPWSPPPGWGPPLAPEKRFINLQEPRFIKGLLIGAAAAWLLGNDRAQQTLIKSAVRMWNGLHGGVEELKERFQDAQAELQAEQEGR